MFPSTCLAAASVISIVLANHPLRPCPPHQPGLVNLGYSKHVPTYTNTTSSGLGVSIYKNIRFANAPTGELRFRAPNINLPFVDGVQNGKVPWRSNDCIASAPGFVPFPGLNGTTWGHEDCLFLDVYVPEGVKPGDQVPVLQYFFGSAYAFGSKDIFFSPMGLFDHMHAQHMGKFIFVVNNYRLGMPGWTYAEGEDMDGNVGLLDCLAAAQWTSKFIDRFGGDGRSITAAGESAGGGMLYYMMAISEKQHSLPFQQAFISSPAAPARRNITGRQKELYHMVLDAANCTSLECLRSISEETMIAVNDKLINHTPSTGGGGVLGPIHGFGPAPDGKLITEMPSAVFRQGRVRQDLKGLILGSMANEGDGLSHDTDMPEYFPVLVRQVMPSASNDTVSKIQGLYHPRKPEQLAWDWTTDMVFACNQYNLANALPTSSRRYIMSTAPAVHGQDVFSFFYVDQESTPVEDVALAREFQTKLLQFVQGKDLDWPLYGAENAMYNITDEFEETKLPLELRRRCDALNGFVMDAANGA